MDHYLNATYVSREVQSPRLPSTVPAVRPMSAAPRPPTAPAIAIAGAMILLAALAGLALMALATAVR